MSVTFYLTLLPYETKTTHQPKGLKEGRKEGRGGPDGRS